MNLKTADLCDAHGDQLQVAEAIFHSYGGRSGFHGVISTLKVVHDYGLIRSTLESPGRGLVLVVDGGGSTKRALLGDTFAKIGQQNGWAGVVIFGAIRDSAELATVDFGVKALATCPMRGDSKGIGHSEVVLRFANISFSPGQYLYADEDGIIVAPKPLHVK